MDAIQVKALASKDSKVLDSVAPEVFDHPIDPVLRDEFLSTPNHHLVVAIDDGLVVGMASGVTYVHPDKPRELWVNEVGVSPSHRRRGVARRMLVALFELARSLGCREAWVLTDKANEAARRLYRSAGGEESEQQMVSFRLQDIP